MLDQYTLIDTYRTASAPLTYNHTRATFTMVVTLGVIFTFAVVLQMADKSFAMGYKCALAYKRYVLDLCSSILS